MGPSGLKSGVAGQAVPGRRRTPDGEGRGRQIFFGPINFCPKRAGKFVCLRKDSDGGRAKFLKKRTKADEVRPASPSISKKTQDKEREDAIFELLEFAKRMTTVEQRLKSFKNTSWAYSDDSPCNVKALAKAGWFYYPESQW